MFKTVENNIIKIQIVTIDRKYIETIDAVISF